MKTRDVGAGDVQWTSRSGSYGATVRGDDVPQDGPALPLIGREGCVAALAGAVAAASAGRFAVVEVCGDAGTGKSRMLALAGELARDAGLEVGHDLGHGGDRRAFVLDDLHRADRATLQRVEHLIRRPPAGGVLVVVAFRGARPPAGVVDAVGRAGEAARRIRLGPLREGDVRAALPHCSPRRLQLLMRASHGIPRYLCVLAELPDATLAELVRQGGDVEPDDVVVHALSAEFGTLSATALRVAQAIAVSGDHAALELVACVARLPVRRVVAAVDELCGAGLGTMRGAWFAFQHPLLCPAARATAGPAWRTRAHARAAEYLSAHGGPPPLLAHHLERSAQYGDEHAAATLLDAGDALVCRAPATAVRLLGTALRIRPAGRRPADTLRYAQALALAGELDLGWDTLQEPLRHDSPLRGDAALVGAEIACLKGDLDTAAALLGDGQRPAAVLRRAALAALRDDVAGTAEHARAAPRRRGGRRPVLVAAALAWRAWAALHAGEVPAARAHARQAARLADGFGTVTLVPRVGLLGLLAAVETRLGDTTAAEGHLTRAYEVTDGTGQRAALPYLLVVDAALQARLGRLPVALDLTEQAASAAEGMGSAELVAMAAAVRVLPLLWVAGPAAVVGRSGELPRSPAWRRIARLGLATAHAVAEDAGCVVALLSGPEETWPADPLTRVVRLGGLAQARALAGDLDAAFGAADEAQAVALGSGLDYETGLAWYATAQVTARAGRSVHAGELAARAAARFATCAAPVEEARARHLAAVCAGHADRAHAEVGLAKAGYAACGADWLLSQATRDQRRIAARNARRRGSALDDAGVLTVRERQIADLVAGGLSNQQIADRLFLSRRTVESHLSRIFPKLAVRSRVAMARRLARE